MPRFVTATVSEILAERPGLQRVATDAGRAYVLVDLVGPVALGDEVVLNTTAVELGLGTGGWHVVHWNLARRSLDQPGPGHIMKLRYTSLQCDTGAAEEDHADLPETLAGTPVVVCSLHSQVAVVAAVTRHLAADARIAYVMTDGAALPLALSDLVFQMRNTGILDTTITAGNAFGGDLEAVTVPSALLLACHVARADVVVVGMGPGVVGTGSSLGTTAVEVASIVDAVAALDGEAAVCVRASDGDQRERHQGISHHTETALRLARTTPALPLPQSLADSVDVAAILAEAGLKVTTMGRGPDADPLFFAVAGAAGVWAARQLG